MRRALVLAIAAAAALPGAAEGRDLTGAAAPTAAADAAQPSVVLLRSGVTDVDAVVRRSEQRAGVRADHRYRSALKGFAARLTAAQRAALQRDADVAAVVPDTTFSGDGKGSTAPAPAPAPAEIVPAGVRRVRAGTSAGAAVAVLDTGVDLRHGDLDARHGVNCVSPGAAAQDDNGHGTHVAGTIAARHNGAGVVGAAPGTTVYAVKVLGARNTGSLSQILCGIDWVTANAAALGIRVANMSLSGAGTDDGACGQANADLQHQAICRSIATGVTYIAAAGNSGRDLAASAPASYREVLTVAAMNDADGLPGARSSAFACKTSERDDQAGTYSNFGAGGGAAGHLVAAPGTCVVSAKLGGGTSTMTGTSMAAPHVAGIAAICVSAGRSCAGRPPAGVVERLRELAAAAAPGRGFAGDPLAPMSGRAYGQLVDAASA